MKDATATARFNITNCHLTRQEEKKMENEMIRVICYTEAKLLLKLNYHRLHYSLYSCNWKKDNFICRLFINSEPDWAGSYFHSSPASLVSIEY